MTKFLSRSFWVVVIIVLLGGAGVYGYLRYRISFVESEASGTVSVSSPTSGSTVSSPVHFVASGSSSYSITAWAVYDDAAHGYALLFKGDSGTTLDQSISMSAGARSGVVVQFWNSAGAVYKSALLSFTVGSGTTSPPLTSSFDSYPSSANVLNNFYAVSWVDACDTAGTSGNCPERWFTINSTAQTEQFGLYDTKVWGGSLWYTHFAMIDANNWIFDYNVVPHNIPTSLTATNGIANELEFDGNQPASGGNANFVFGTACNLGYDPGGRHVWKFWTNVSGNPTWAKTGFTCPFLNDHKYHVQMHFQIVSPNYYKVVRAKVTDLTTGSVVEDDSNLGTFGQSITDHGSAIDVQLDSPGNTSSNSFSMTYSGIKIVRWKQ